MTAIAWRPTDPDPYLGDQNGVVSHVTGSTSEPVRDLSANVMDWQPGAEHGFMSMTFDPRNGRLLVCYNGGGTSARRSATSPPSPTTSPRRQRGRRSTGRPAGWKRCSWPCTPPPACPAQLDGDELNGLVEGCGDRWVLTRRGRLMANEVSVRLR